MRVTSFLGLSVLVVLVSASACDDGTGGGGGNSGELTVDTFYEAFDSARCDYFVRCGYLHDKALCGQAYGADADAAQGVASTVFGSLGFDAAKAKACVDSFAIALCDTAPSAGVSDSIEAACSAAFTGKGADGAACFQGVECTSGNCETESCTDQCCLGKCKAEVLIPEGGACPNDGKCVAGAYCDTEDMPVCKKQKGANEACSNPYSCVDGYVCDDQGGKCFKQSPTGASCNPTLATSPCEQSAAEYCHPDTKLCTPLPKPGEPCVASGPFMNACARDSHCEGSSGTNLCKQLPAEGEPCLGDAPGVCLGSLQCQDVMGMPTCVRNPAHTCVPN